MVMSVIEISARLPHGKFIVIAATRRHGLLRNLSWTVHLVRDNKSVPMNCCRFRQVVVKNHAYMIAFGELQARTWNLTIKGVGFNCDVGQDIPTYHRSLQFIDLDAVFKMRF